MRSSFDPTSVKIPEADLSTTKRVLATYSPTASLRSEEPREITHNELIELRNELTKLRSTILLSQENFDMQIQPLNIQITNFELSSSQSLQQIQTRQNTKQNQQNSQKTNQTRNPKSRNKDNKHSQDPQLSALFQQTMSQMPQAPPPLPKEKNRGSERTVRLHSEREKEQQITGNPLDIWVRSEPMFAPLPTQEEMTGLFTQIIEKSLQGAQVTVHVPTEPVPHWSNALLEKMQKFTTKEAKRMPKLLPPPGPPPAPDDIAEYWKTHTPQFPIQNSQKRNNHTIHRLLAAVVETDAAQFPQRPITEPRKPYLPINVLAPKLEHERYLCLDFEDRLDLELKSVGLDSSQSVNMTDDDTFVDEISKYKQQLLQLIPEVQKSSKMLIEKIPIFRRVEDQRYIEQAMYQELYQVVQRKHRKK